MSTIKNYVEKNYQQLKKIEVLFNIIFVLGLITNATFVDKDSVLLLSGAVSSSLIAFLLSQKDTYSEKGNINIEDEVNIPSQKFKLNKFFNLISSWSISLSFIGSLYLLPSHFAFLRGIVLSAWALLIVSLCYALIRKNQQFSFYLKCLMLVAILSVIIFNGDFWKDIKKVGEQQLKIQDK
jgi:hypothetical protein